MRRLRNKIQEKFANRFSWPSWSKRRDDSRNPYEKLGRSPTPYGKRRGAQSAAANLNNANATITASNGSISLTSSPSPNSNNHASQNPNPKSQKTTRASSPQGSVIFRPKKTPSTRAIRQESLHGRSMSLPLTHNDPPQFPPIRQVTVVSKHTPRTLLPSSSATITTRSPTTTPPPPVRASSSASASSSQQRQVQNGWFNSADTSPDSPTAPIGLLATPTMQRRRGEGRGSGEWPLLGGPATPESVLQQSAERRWKVRRGLVGAGIWEGDGREQKTEREE